MPPSESKNSTDTYSVDSLDSKYQVQKLLESGDVVTSVTAVGVSHDNLIYFVLDVDGHHNFVTVIEESGTISHSNKSTKQAHQLFSFLFTSEHGATVDLSHLIGRQIYLESAGGTQLTTNDSITLRIIDETPTSIPQSQTLSTEYLHKLIRCNRWHSKNRQFLNACVEHLETDGDTLSLQLTVLEEPVQWTVQIPTPITTPSPYTLLVEELGQGSVNQIKSGNVVLIPECELSKQPRTKSIVKNKMQIPQTYIERNSLGEILLEPFTFYVLLPSDAETIPTNEQIRTDSSPLLIQTPVLFVASGAVLYISSQAGSGDSGTSVLDMHLILTTIAGVIGLVKWTNMRGILKGMWWYFGLAIIWYGFALLIHLVLALV